MVLYCGFDHKLSLKHGIFLPTPNRVQYSELISGTRFPHDLCFLCVLSETLLSPRGGVSTPTPSKVEVSLAYAKLPEEAS